MRFLFLAAAAFFACIAATPARDIQFTRPKLAGIPANVVVVNLKSKRLEVQPFAAESMPGTPPHRARPFAAMVKSLHCLAAINGTFFDPRTRTTIGSMIYGGKIVNSGYVGNALAVDSHGRAHYIEVNRRSTASVDWTPYRFAITGGPTLIYRGHIHLDPQAEGFHDPRLLKPAKRSALGFRKNREMVMVTVNKAVSLQRLARMMAALHVEYALNLDGGYSCGLYCEGKWIARPRYPLTNILAVTATRRVAARVRYRRLTEGK